MSYNALLINTCDVELETKDKWGKITLLASTAGVPCRIEYANKIVRSMKGQEVLSTARVFFKATAPIEEGTRLFFDGRWHGILTIERNQNSVSVHHLEVRVD